MQTNKITNGTIVNVNGDRGIVLSRLAGPEGIYVVAFNSRIEKITNPVRDKKQSLAPGEFIEPTPDLVDRADMPTWAISSTWNGGWRFIGYEEFSRSAWRQIHPMERSRIWVTISATAILVALSIQIRSGSGIEPTPPARVFGWISIAAGAKFFYDCYIHFQEIK